MRPLEKTKWFKNLSILGFSVLLLSQSAPVRAQTISNNERSGVHSFSFGIAIPTALGHAYENYSRSVGYELKAWYSVDGWGNTAIQVSGSVLPFNVRGLNDSKVYYLGGFGGVQTHGTGALWGMMPTLAAEIGVVYDWLTFPNSSTANVSNAAFGFATRLTPGVDVPLGSSFSALFEFPWETVFYKSTICFWSGNISFRVRF